MASATGVEALEYVENHSVVDLQRRLDVIPKFFVFARSRRAASRRFSLCGAVRYHVRLMIGWKKLAVTAAGFGCSFAVVFAAILGGWIWYQERSQREHEWNTTAIKATFKDVMIITSVPKPKLTFSYSLENTTDFDYSIDDKSRVLVMVTLPEGKGFEPDEALSLPSSLYIPAKQKVVLTLTKESEYNNAYPEQDRDNGAKLAAFMDRRLKEIDGFVLFDKMRRYEVTLPNGWNNWSNTKQPGK